jgi:hypothetical protein
MTSMMGVRSLALATGLLLAAALPAAEPPVTTIEFSPAVEAKLHSYGEDQRTLLQNAILVAVGRAAATSPAMAGREIAVRVEDVTPTHPTPAQLAADPAMSAARSKFLGGAQLTAEVRDANHHVLTVVNHSYFAYTLELGSSSLDPWADARLAIDQFGVKLAAACRGLLRS